LAKIGPVDFEINGLREFKNYILKIRNRQRTEPAGPLSAAGWAKQGHKGRRGAYDDVYSPRKNSSSNK